MGVDGLWPLLQGAAKQLDLKAGDAQGLRLGIDTYVLLHAAAADYGVAIGMVVRGQPAPMNAVARVAHAFEKLREWGVTAVAFFDGAPRPYKLGEVNTRGAKRSEAAAKARELFSSSQHSKEMREQARAAARVTPELRRATIYELKKAGVPVVGAPYEADGQLAWAFKQKKIGAVLTVDGDLLVLGCKVFRLRNGDPFGWMRSGCLDVYDMPALASLAAGAVPAEPDLAWAVSTFGCGVLTDYGVLCGCDFNLHKGFRGVGPTSAWAILLEVGRGAGGGWRPASGRPHA